MKILDLGCGRDKYRGGKGDMVIGVDVDKQSGADVIHDLNKFPYPFKKNEFDLVRLKHSIEHLQDVYKVLDEVCKITRNGGTVRILYPHFSCASAYNTYTHIHFFGINALIGIHPNLKLVSKELHWYPNSSNFIINTSDRVLSYLANLNPTFCERLWCHWVGGFFEVELNLRVEK